MFGPSIVARTISRPTVRGIKSTVPWQYHGRSDVHSKVACWAVLFDLLHGCDVFAAQALAGKLSFAVNHLMVGPINKTLDLVVCARGKGRRTIHRESFEGLATKFGVQLSDEEREILVNLPEVEVETGEDFSEVLIALEAKACFTDLVGSIPRLHAEILATGYLAKKASPSCLTASYTLVNAAESFQSPGKAAPKAHKQPSDASAVMAMIRNAIPRATDWDFGYDAIGASLVSCRNDGSQVEVIESSPAPTHTDFIHYDRMMASLCGAYRHRFAHR